MAHEKPGDAAIFAGRNHEKIGMIARAVEAGLHVLCDKPMIVRRDQLPALAAVLDRARAKGLVIQDMMGGRQEITRALTRLIHADVKIFGEQIPGSAAEPGVAMTSLHHLMKIVSGVPNPRPAWYFDVRQQGDALADIGTRLVDRVHGTLFPGTALSERDISVASVRRWPTMLDRTQFRHVTGAENWPDYLGAAVAGGTLAYQCNAHLDDAVRGVNVGLDMVWEWLEPPGGGDTHTETWHGTRARIETSRSGGAGAAAVRALCRSPISARRLNCVSPRWRRRMRVSASKKDGGDWKIHLSTRTLRMPALLRCAFPRVDQGFSRPHRATRNADRRGAGEPLSRCRASPSSANRGST